MITFMKRILQENEFNIDEIGFENENTFLADRLEGTGFDFLTVTFMNQDEISEEMIMESLEHFHSAISEKKGVIVGLEKNLSLLVMLKVNSLDHPAYIQSLIFDIEEDPYTFKKYILTYTDEQEELLKSLFKESNQVKVTSLLYEILYDIEKFYAFKNGVINESYLIYDLISKMFIKLPYLSIKNQQKQLDFLLNDILESFDDDDRDIWNLMMGLMQQNENDPSIEDTLKAIGVEKSE